MGAFLPRSVVPCSRPLATGDGVEGTEMTNTATIQLPDGYNGHTVTCFAKPIMEGKSIVWLQVAEPGKQYMRRWCHRETYERALREVQS